MSPDRWTNKKLVPIAQLLLVAQLSAISPSSINEDCNDISSHSQCNCLPVSHGFEISCPGEEISPEITVRTQKNQEVKIECRGMDPFEYSLLPRMSIGNILKVRMHQCPLPLEQPIQTIVQKLGITRVNSLIFELSGSLRRLHFQGLDNLIDLRLNISNALSTLSVDVFAELKNLTYFHLYNNREELKHLPAGLLSNLHILRKVLLNCNLVTISSDVFADSTAIRNITISENNLTKLPRMLFANQKTLIYLNLARNKLIALPKNIFQNTTKLIVLRLSHNWLEKVGDYIFYSLENLKELYMDNNNLVRISDITFWYTKTLTYINMENNQLDVTGSVNKMGRVYETLHVFTDLKNLTILNLRNNSFTSIPRVESMLPSILDLSFNNIIMFDHLELVSVENDITVNLTHNSIRTINFDRIHAAIRKNYQIHIAIGENPIKCDCGIASFVMFLNGKLGQHRRGALTVSNDKLQCSAPANLKGRLIPELLRKEYACPLDESSTQQICPTGCVCSEERFGRILIVGCSNAELTQIPALSTMEKWKGTELHMKNNSFTQISADNLPENIVLLDISYNNIQQLNSSVLRALTANTNLYSLALSHNPWMCDCQTEELFQFVHSYHERIPDLNKMHCASGEKLLEISVSIICLVKQRPVIVVGGIILVIGLCVATVAALYYKYQIEIKVWLYAHNMCLWFVTEEELDKTKKYDAFISFSSKDEDFIMDHLVPELENGTTPFELCLHHRDWVAGVFIPSQIVRSVEESRRTVIVLSPNFIESIWARMEFRTAHTAALNEGRARVIVIIFGEIGNIDTLDPELKAYLQMHTYIKWGDPWFWKKLRYALPHKSNNISRRNNEMVVHQPQREMEMTTNPTI